MRKAPGYLCFVAVAAAMLVVAAPAAHAEPVDGPWENADGFGDGPYTTTTSNTFILGEEPNDPLIGSNFAEQEMIFSPFSTMMLVNPGDKVVFTGTIELSGTTNSPLSSGTPRTQFRFGLFQGNANTDETGWVGYYMSNKHGNAGTPSGVLALKPVDNTSVFLSVTGQTVLTSVQGDGTEASRFNDGTYDLMMSIERNAAGELVINSSILGVGDRPPVEPYDPAEPPPSPGPNEFSQIMSVTTNPTDPDPDPPNTLGTYTFDRLGFLSGGNLDADRIAFSNLEVTFIPGGAALVGDHNGDGTVDAADYVVWRKSDSGNAQGYTDWRTHFGETSGGGAAAGAAGVPEPATYFIALLAAAVIVARMRRPKAALQPVRVR